MLRAPVASEMIEKLLEGKWRRAVDVRRWFAQEHGVEVALSTVYKYLGKSEVRLKVPRPSHARKDAAAAETFKSELAAKLRELDIEMDRRVRIWVADEMRYGLQPVIRRVWALKGTRGVKRCRTGVGSHRRACSILVGCQTHLRSHWSKEVARWSSKRYFSERSTRFVV